VVKKVRADGKLTPIYASDNSSVNDGINYTDDFLDEQLYRDTFKMIFKYMNQEQHFNMMMGNEQGE